MPPRLIFVMVTNHRDVLTAMTSLMVSSDYYVVNDNEEDYLRDPAMWWDTLPQPYRLIDDLMQDLFCFCWDTILDREMSFLQNQTNDKPIKLSEGTILTPIPEPSCLSFITADNGSTYMFAVASSELHGDELNGIVHCGHCSLPINGKAISMCCQYVDGDKYCKAIIALGKAEDGVQLFCYKGREFHAITELVDGITTVHDIVLSNKASCMAVSGYSSNNSDADKVLDCLFNIYSLPIENWSQQLSLECQQVNLGKPSLLVTLSSPPSHILPPLHIDYNHFKTYRSWTAIPTITHQGLTQSYLEVRRGSFLSKRKAFITESSQETLIDLYTCSISKVYFLHYWKLQYSKIPKTVALWRNRSAQLHVYSIHSKVPDAIYTCTSSITSIKFDFDTKYLSLGTQKGFIYVYNLMTGVCLGTYKAFSKPVLSLCMIPPHVNSNFDMVVVGGGTDNRIICSKWKRQTLMTTKMYTVSTDVVQLYQTFTIPNIFISLHTDGSLVVWEWSENRPLLKLSLPQSYTLTDKIIVTSDSVVAVCKASITTDFEQYCVLYWNLSTTEAMHKEYDIDVPQQVAA